MGKRSHKFSWEKLIHREKTKLGPPADCLHFPVHFLLGVGKPQLDDVTCTAIFLFLSFSLFYLEASPKKHSTQVWKPQLAASSQLLQMISAECSSARFDPVLKSTPSYLFFYFDLLWMQWPYLFKTKKKALEHRSLDVREQQQKDSYTMDLNELVNFPLILRELYSNEAIFHFALC